MQLEGFLFVESAPWSPALGSVGQGICHNSVKHHYFREHGQVLTNGCDASNCTWAMFADSQDMIP